MLAYPPLSISFKMYVQSSFIYPLSSFQSLSSIIYSHIYSYYLLIYGLLIMWNVLLNLLCKRSLHYPID